MGHPNQKEQKAQLTVIQEQQENTRLELVAVNKELVAVNKKMDMLISRLSVREASATSSSVQDRDSEASSIEQFWTENITKITPLRYQVRRAGVDRILKDPINVARGCRIVPAMRDGKAVGFKLYAIRPMSLWARLGFENGDTLHSINGNDLNTPDMALHAYSSLKESTNFMVRLTRQGKPFVLEISIVDQN